MIGLEWRPQWCSHSCMPKWIGRICLFSLIAFAAQSARAAELPAFLESHCLDCHDADTQKGKLRLDDLGQDYGNPQSFARWRKVLSRVQDGSMPPADKRQPSHNERIDFAELLTPKLQAADAARIAREGRVVYRRLNREEYQNTVRDLLGIDTELKDYLPEDGQAHGFDNVGKALNISSVLMERYLEAADVALDAAIARFKPPETKIRRYSPLDDSRLVKNKNIFRVHKDGLVFFSSSYSPTGLRAFRAPAAGRYRFRIATTAFQTDQPVTFRVYGGMVNSRDGKTELIDYFDVPPGKQHVTEFECHLPKDGSIRPVPYGTGGDIYQIKAAKYKDAGLLVHWIEGEGPLDSAWPPESHTRLFSDIPLKEIELDPRERRRRRSLPEYRVVSSDPKNAAAQVIEGFVARAFRRPTTDEDAQPFVALAHQRLTASYEFTEAVRVGLKAVLCSPQFIFFNESPGQLDNFALANRLSYFLWSTMPDSQLLDVAASGALQEEKTLQNQVRRMLRDDRSKAFVRNFTGQWLDLREIDFTTPDRHLYPEFDELLQVSMVKETELFFEELLRRNHPVQTLFDSPFLLLNERLARHYGIEEVRGQQFRKVALPAGSHRGSILTHASVLKVTANGTSTSPVLRGVWVLEKIFGTPASPPPAGVPAVEPDIRGARSIREMLAKHRSDPACNVCHNKIDPAGFALENFDVIGGWREHYRSIDKGDRVNKVVNGRGVRYRRSLPVDASGHLPDGRSFRNMDDFVKLIAHQKDSARGLTEHLVVYATGGEVSLADHPGLSKIAQTAGLTDLITTVVQSKIFRHK
jgi:hypothetical protein